MRCYSTILQALLLRWKVRPLSTAIASVQRALTTPLFASESPKCAKNHCPAFKPWVNTYNADWRQQSLPSMQHPSDWKPWRNEWRAPVHYYEHGSKLQPRLTTKSCSKS